MALDDNATIGFCVLCGRPDRRQLCRDCRVEWSEDDQLPAWLKALQNDQHQQAKKARRAAAWAAAKLGSAVE